LGNTKNYYVPQKIENFGKINQISAGGYHSIALSSDGTLYSCKKKKKK
jgi:alpha-tubulin suppressor-like RCC1 family protein